jgi:hypothetical protein
MTDWSIKLPATMYARCGMTITSPLPTGLRTVPFPSPSPALSGAQSPASTRATAVLPAPFGPVIIRCSPGRRRRLRSRTSTSGSPRAKTSAPSLSRSFFGFPRSGWQVRG